MQRHLDVVPLSRSQTQRVVQPVFGEDRVRRHDLLEGGLVNTNYKVQFESGRSCVVRVMARGRDAFTLEGNILSQLAAHDRIPVPKVLASEPSPSEIAAPIMIQEWVEGMALEKILDAGNPSDNKEAGRSVGRMLAEIGKLRLELPTYPLEEAIPFVQQCLFEQGGNYFLDDALLDRLWKFMTDNASFLMGFKAENVLVHGDFRPENILMSYALNGWNVAAVLDWEFAHLGSPLLDVGSMLRNEHAYHPNFVQAFVEGYKENGGVLAEDWHKAAKIFDIVNQVEKLARRAEQFLTGGGQIPIELHQEDAIVIEAVEIIRGTLDTYD